MTSSVPLIPLFDWPFFGEIERYCYCIFDQLKEQND